MKRSGWLKRRTPLRSRNPERSEREFRRCYHSRERVLFVKHALQCEVPGCGRTPCENAHLGNEGLSRKSHYTRTVALCWLHHRGLRTSLDQTSQEAFEKEYGIDLDQLAAWTEERWQARGQQWVEQVKRSGRWEELVGR